MKAFLSGSCSGNIKLRFGEALIGCRRFYFSFTRFKFRMPAFRRPAPPAHFSSTGGLLG
jgi:hypothetical protein